MEEADILSDRIGIMDNGILRCIGTSHELKQRYGRGFKLTLGFRKNVHSIGARAHVLQQIEAFLPPDQWTKVDQGLVSGCVIYEIDIKNESNIASILESVEMYKDQFGIENWGIAQTSLEEVFLNVCGTEQSNV